MNRYDIFWLKIAGKIVTKWNNLTGQCNTALARFVFHLGLTILGVSMIVNVAIAKHPPSTWAWFFGFVLLAGWFWIWKDTTNFFKKVDESLEAAEDQFAFKIDLKMFERIMFRARYFIGLAVFFFLINILSFNFNGMISNTGLFCVGFSIYVGMYVKPKKKDHALARAKKKVTSAASTAKDKAKDLIPSPLPTPVAVKI